VELYGGDLLADAYDDWVLELREHLARRFERCLARLAALEAATGESAAAVATAERLLSRDPLREETHRLLMGLRYLAGDRAAALRQVADCEGLIQAELGVAPMPETRVLRAAIEAGAPPERLAELLVDELPAGLPPAAAPHRPAHNLPRPLTAFIGREREMAAIGELLDRARLVTLTGPGGCGKTRLALETAWRQLADRTTAPAGSGASAGGAPPAFRDGVWLVELAPLAEPALVSQAVAGALGVREEPGRPLAHSLAEALGPRELLLVLDNCEHLRDACAELAAALLRASPSLRVLATSREPLGVAGETVRPVPPLSLPAAAEPADEATVRTSEAARLFLDRAYAAQAPSPLGPARAAAVAQVCRRLDGLPLALELAAARARAMPLGELAAGLDDAFRLLDGPGVGAPPQQRTLSATVDWSHALLGPAERELFARLSVFAGGFTLEAAAAVGAGAPDEAGADRGRVLGLLSRLVERSLVSLDRGNGEERYRLLEILRQYARGRLEASGREGETRRRHAHHFLGLVQAAEPELAGPNQQLCLDRLEAEAENLREALGWACATGEAALALDLAGTLVPFWEARGRLQEGRDWLARALALPAASEPSAARARALRGAGVIAGRLAESASACGALEESLAIARRLGDRRAEALALNALGLASLSGGDYGAALELYRAGLAIARELGWRHREGVQLGNCAFVLWHLGQYAPALDCAEQALRIAREGGDPSEEGRAHINAGRALHHLGHAAEAEARLREALDLSRGVGSPYLVANALAYLALALLETGDEARRSEAESLAAEAVGLAYAVGLAHAQIQGLALLSLARLARGDAGGALDSSSRAVALLEGRGQQEVPAEGVYFIHQQVLRAAGRELEADQALRQAAQLVAAKAARLEKPALRRAFLDQVTLNRRILAAVEERLGPWPEHERQAAGR
jgi:non-specific serine/threonine protein kinase